MTIDEIKRIASTFYEAQAVEAQAARNTTERRQELQEALAAQLGLDVWKVELGEHACSSSPTGQCVYNVNEDPTQDRCLFCGSSSEDAPS